MWVYSATGDVGFMETVAAAFRYTGMTENREKKSRKELAMAHLRTVERFLQVWDPIGIIEDEIDNGTPPTEYDTYAPRVLALLQRGISTDDLVNHLSGLRRDLGLDPDDPRDLEAAKSIMQWWQTERVAPAG